MAERAVFIPVCLYSVRLKSKRVLAQVLRAHAGREERVLILVCDQIHALNLQIRQGLAYGEAQRRAIRQGDEVARMAANCILRLRLGPRVRVERWGSLAGSPAYAAVEAAVEELERRDAEFGDIVQSFVVSSLSRFGTAATSMTSDLERRYLRAEVAMTIYTAEMLGYWLHVWEELVPAGAPDPIGFLYRERRPAIRQISGASSLRREIVGAFAECVS